MPGFLKMTYARCPYSRRHGHAKVFARGFLKVGIIVQDGAEPALHGCEGPCLCGDGNRPPDRGRSSPRRNTWLPGGRNRTRTRRRPATWQSSPSDKFRHSSPPARGVKEVALLGVVRAGGIAGRRTDAAVALVNQILERQVFILAITPNTPWRACASTPPALPPSGRRGLSS